MAILPVVRNKTDVARLRRNMRIWFRAAMVVACGLVCVVGYRYEMAGSPDADSLDTAAPLAPLAASRSHQQGRTLLNSNVTQNCSTIPPRNQLAAWRTHCIDVSGEHLTGAPYLVCLEHWYDVAKDCGSFTEACSFSSHCSDMSSYPGMAVNGFGGGVVLYLLGIMYMFAGLAIVCDEYFVPALEVITEKLDVSDDVAGATLMAAGGSAPELFTSVIGVFIAKSDVGFSTIVGSAVFNVLFVIGMCALFSKELLVLTGWPITRDSLYYSVTLICLAMFYRYGTTEEKCIEWWEAVIMFALYLGYVTLMKFNQPLKKWFYKKKKQLAYRTARIAHSFSRRRLHGNSSMTDAEAAAHRHGDHDLRKLHKGGNQVSFRHRRKLDARNKTSARFRIGVLDMLLRDKDILGKLRVQAVAGFMGDVRQTFNQFDTNGNGLIDKDELGSAIRVLLGFDPGADDLNKTLAELVTDVSDEAGGKQQVSYDEFERWYQQSEYSLQAEMHSVFNEMDSEKDGMIDEEEFRKVLHKLEIKEKPLTEEELKHGLQLFGGVNEKISFLEFCEWYKTTILYTHKLEKHKQELHTEAHAKKHEDAEEEEDEEGVSLAIPGSCRGKIFWALLFPINAPMYFTIPDVRWGGVWHNMFAATFVLAILWIGIFSYFMVWWAIIIGDYIGIPQGVMGVTFLAAGTSVPDLITSVIVARQGHGDMAVSSSIGSNIFDVTVGLPFPWILHNIAIGKVPLAEDGTLFYSLLLLFMMLFAVIITIIVSGFKMTKTLGATMFVLYVVFVVQDLLRQYKILNVNF